MFSVEGVRDSVPNAVASPVVVPKDPASTTVFVDDTLDAELLAEPEPAEVGDNAGGNNEEVDPASVVDPDGQGDVSDAASVSSDVEMHDLSEQVLDSVADLFE